MGHGLESIFATFLNCFCLCAFHHKECFTKKLCKQKSHWRCKGFPHYIFQSLDLYLKNKLKQTKKQKKNPTLKLTNQLPPPTRPSRGLIYQYLSHNMETACAKQHLLQLHLANIQLLAGLPRKVLRDTAVQLDMYAEQKMI